MRFNIDRIDIITCIHEKIIGLIFQAKLETKALKAKRPGFTDERYNETSYYIENGKKNFEKKTQTTMYQWEWCSRLSIRNKTFRRETLGLRIRK